MKSLLLIGSVLAMANSCNKGATPTTGTAAAAAGYQVSGQLTNAPAGTKVYLAELGDTQFEPRDTATLDAQGKYVLQGTTTAPGMYQLKVTDASQVLLVLDNQSRVQLTGDATKLGEGYTVKGSKDSELWQRLNSSLQQSKLRMAAVEQRYGQNAQAGRTDSLQLLKDKYLAVQAGTTAAIKRVVRENPKSVLSAFVVGNLLNPDEQFGFADSMATQFKQTMPDSRYTKALVARLEPLRSTARGEMAPEISLPAPDGKTVALSSLRGKYVLIDFWASWCGPCRQENPNVVKAYKRFKSKGFEIYSVSFDQDRGKWLKAIQADGLTWTHVSDLKGWESVAGQTYGVKSIPLSILLDPQGRIIDKNLRGEALEAKLASVLK
ncbi:Peroxiredoxin [Hymenobacter daecheongensis DSM 21074]|uniref:Peroxiredoxin n=2 Tax=Hymenobacter daecheongensis TaxID=496053 RepID=A0A1M6K0H3_9BACT|nr:Peroxiredoxin [Hymenobacter daecheongensis DSM 21074]